MESFETKMMYVYYTKALCVEEKFRERHISGAGKDAEFEKVSMGYYGHFEGSSEALSFGHAKPDIQTGDVVKVTIQKVA